MTGEDSEQVDRVQRVWLLVIVLLALSASLHACVSVLADVATGTPDVPWQVLAGVFALTEVCVVHVRWGREAHTFGLAEVPLVLGLFLVPGEELIWARLVGAGIALAVVRRQSLLKVAFNLAQWWLGTAVAVLLFHTSTQLHGPYDATGWLVAVGATLAADVLGSLAILVAMGLRGSPVGVREAWTSIWTGAVPAAANACLALVTLDVLLVDWRGGWALLVVGTFVAVAQRAHVGLQRRHDGLERLNAFSATVTGTLDVGAVIEEVLRGTAALLEAGECELVLAPAFAGEQVCFRRVDGQPVRRCAGAVEVLPPVTARVQRRWTGRPQLSSLTEHLVERDAVVGALTVRRRLGDVGGFDAEDLRLLRALVGHVGAALVNGRLADQLREQVRENEFQALHDALTGLANRVLFDRAVSHALADGTALTAMLLDLDRFKEVNDTLGHATGDELLTEVGTRIQAAVPDVELVARLGGDEFAIFLLGADPEAALRCADAVREALLRPLVIQGVTLSVDASVGVALAPEHGTEIQALMRHADVAMYRAKHDRSGVELYAADADQHSETRLSLVSELRDGIRAGQLELWFQPKVDLSTRAVRSVEALVRWRHPTRGLVPPDEFIPCAEQTGLVDPLTDWVLEEALRQCASWHAAGRLLAVAVNVSPRTLRRETFADDVRAALQRRRVPPWALTLEITESVMMEDPQGAGARLRELRALGVKVSVDDFGTGYSSLANLKHLPVDEVKIDRSFVRHLDEDVEDEAIVASIVQLVHRLGLSVVAEGVETEQAWDRLLAMGCDVAQGYLLSRPVPAAVLEEWCDGRLPVPAPRPAPRLRVVPAS